MVVANTLAVATVVPVVAALMVETVTEVLVVAIACLA